MMETGDKVDFNTANSVVRDRSDGQNVNGWHWSERNVTNWADSRLRELISPITGESASVAKIEKVSGEATLWNRKGKLKVVYDLKVEGGWVSCPLNEDEAKNTKGKFVFELFDDDPDINATIDSKSAADPKYKSAFIAECVPSIRSACSVFIADLMAGADVAGSSTTPAPAAATRVAQGSPSKDSILPEAQPCDFKRTPGVDTTTAEFRKRENAKAPLIIVEGFTCSAEDLYAALVGERARIEAVTRGKVTSEARPGGTWEVCGGLASGVVREVDPGRKVVMDWRMQDWEKEEEGVVSLRMDFEQDEGRTKLTIAITGLPDKRKSAVEGFWRLRFFKAIKLIFGRCSLLFARPRINSCGVCKTNCVLLLYGAVLLAFAVHIINLFSKAMEMPRSSKQRSVSYISSLRARRARGHARARVRFLYLTSFSVSRHQQMVMAVGVVCPSGKDYFLLPQIAEGLT